MQTKASDWVANYALRYPDKPACIDVDGNRSFTYKQINERAQRLANFLNIKFGIKKGERLAILAHNSAEHIVIQAACMKAGAVMVPLNWRLTVPELEHQLNNSQPQLLIYGTSFESNAIDAAGKSGVRHLLAFCEDGTHSDYEAGIEEHDSDYEPAEVYHTDPWTILYTSGTTGLPKGAIITHGMSLYNAINYSLVVGVNHTSVYLCAMPLFHTGGLNNNVNVTIHQGGTLVLCRQFDADVVLRLISDPELAVTHFFGVPATYQMLCQHPAFDDADLSRLVSASVGGTPVPLSLHHLWRNRGVSFQEGYGMTESGPSVFISDLEMPLEKLGSTGKPVMHCEVRLVDDTGNDVAADEVGEIWIRGPSITPGYWDDPEATRDAFTDGWFRTGDAARRDPDGYYYIVDRWKDMYISGGENVYPAEIENVLFEISAIKEAAVIGIADKKWGEVGCAAIVLKQDQQLSEAAVLQHCKGKLAGYKLPKSVVFLDSLPRNAINKVVKDRLRKQLGFAPLVQK